MVFSKKAENPNCSIMVKGNVLKQNQDFQYLGSWVTSDGKPDKEIRHRIGMAKTAYRKMERVLASHSIKFATKLRLLKWYVWSVLLYGLESWTIRPCRNDCKRLRCDSWGGRFERIPWADRVTNEEMLGRAGTHRQLMRTIVTRQIFFLTILLKEQMEELALTGQIAGKRSRGRQRLTYLGWLQRASWHSDWLIDIQLQLICRNFPSAPSSISVYQTIVNPD